ncbi:MAG: BrnT family toxin [Bdellovibrionaceae bacterium]|nr:BrnT family toxin [Pseudobdellovibrionaceae bacterium]
MRYLQWDPAKARANEEKHGVSFEEAATIFDDPLLLLHEDEKHSRDELRLIAIGESDADRVLFVVFTERRSKSHEEEICRILSARAASKKERQRYFKAPAP